MGVGQSGVDHRPQRLVRQRADGRQHLRAHLLVTGVDEQHPLIADLHRDVAAGARDHVDLALHRQRLHLELRPIRLRRKRHLLRRPDLRPRLRLRWWRLRGG
jgi:hypothetical protein